MKPSAISEVDAPRIRQMRKDGMSWMNIARRLNSSFDTVRGLVDPEYREHANARRQRQRDDNRWRSNHTVNQKSEAFTPSYDPRRDGLPQWRSIDAYVFGDPPIGRSALDKRNGAKF